MFTNFHGALTVLVLIVLQKVEAVFKKAAADHEKFKTSLAKDPQFLQNMQKELQEIDSEILQLEQDR
jgi:cysteinyl-tRNA synthetase